MIDFGFLEVQAVYISGNIRRPFEYYIADPSSRSNMTWTGKPNYPKPDYLSSSRKRLVPQLLYKGGILNSWVKKQAVVLQEHFFDTLPEIPTVKAEDADMAWFLLQLQKDKASGRFRLVHKDTVYTKFTPALNSISTPKPGEIGDFIELLQGKLDEKLNENPPETHTIAEIPCNRSRVCRNSTYLPPSQ